MQRAELPQGNAAHTAPPFTVPIRTNSAARHGKANRSGYSEFFTRKKSADTVKPLSGKRSSGAISDKGSKTKSRC